MHGRLQRLAPALVASALVSCGGDTIQGWEGAEAPPNVLLITVDTLRADVMGAYGYARPTTPELDAFAATATVFEQPMSSASWTLPSFASLFTSLFSSTHQCWKLFSKLDDSFETLAEVLTRHGYDTACFVSHTMLNPSQGMQQGFVHFDDSYADPEADTELRISSEYISDRGLRFLEQKSAVADGVPWMLWLHYFDPHSYYMNHEGVTETFLPPDADLHSRAGERGRYDGEVRYTDHHIGRVLRALEEEGLDESTIVVFVADHGEEFFEHGNTEHGSTLFNELVRVPLFIRVPGEQPRRVSQVVRTVDVMPTLIDYAGASIEREIEGRSLRRLVEGSSMSLPPALLEIRQSDATLMEGVVSGRWKLVHHLDDDHYELYDLESDPLEQEDLAEKEPERVKQLTKTLRNMVAEAQRRSRSYSVSGTEEASPMELEALKGLGYINDD